MKKNTRISLVVIISLVVAVCAGCSAVYEDTTTKESYVNSEIETTDSHFTRYSSSPLYSFIYRNGVEKKGVAVETIDYKEEPIKLSFDYKYGNPTETDEEVEELFFVILNGELCITELKGGAKGYYHIKKSNINVGTSIEFYVYPHKLNKDKTNEILVCHIPIGMRSEQYGDGTRDKPNYRGIIFNRYVISAVDLKETIDDSVNDVVIEKFENLYGKTLEEMKSIQKHKYINDVHMIFDTEGGYMYSFVPRETTDFTGTEECILYTLLFCDGKLYNGFDGKYMLSWNMLNDLAVHYEIDTSGMEKGTHEIYLININSLNNLVQYSDVYTIEVE